MTGILQNYLPLVVFVGVASLIGLVLLIAPFLVAFQQPDPEKLSAYECGFNAFDDARMKFDVRFYLVAILFIIFDLEVAFLFPWAVAFGKLGATGFWSMVVFLAVLTVGFALNQLLDAAQAAAIPRYAGYILATTVFGWATGGVIGGIIADYIGRKRTMLLAILAYSLTTGLSAFAWDWVSFAVLRFLVGWRSVRNGRLAPRSFPSCGLTTRAAKSAGCCSAEPGSAAICPLNFVTLGNDHRKLSDRRVAGPG